MWARTSSFRATELLSDLLFSPQMSTIPVDLRLAKMLVLASIFKCLVSRTVLLLTTFSLPEAFFLLPRIPSFPSPPFSRRNLSSSLRWIVVKRLESEAVCSTRTRLEELKLTLCLFPSLYPPSSFTATVIKSSSTVFYRQLRPAHGL